MSRHRLEVRPRYGRIAVLASRPAWSPAVAVLGGVGAAASSDAEPPRRPAPTAATVRRAGRRRPGRRTRAVHAPTRRPGEPAPRRRHPRAARGDDPAGGLRHRASGGVQRGPAAGLAGHRRRAGAAHLPGLRQRRRQPRPGHLRGLLALRAGLGHRRLRHDAVVRAVRPRRQRRHRLPRHPGRRRHAGADPRPARHPAVPRLHPPEGVRRHGPLGVRPARHHGRRRRPDRWTRRSCCSS